MTKYKDDIPDNTSGGYLSVKAKGLGTGLGALFGSAAEAELQNDFEYVPIQRIEPKQDQPRSVFEQNKIDELADSIREHGVLSPLTVRSIGDGYYQIIAGERRWRAAREAGSTEIPVRIIDADDQKALELALVENLQREDLNPIDEARGYKTLMSDFSLTQDEIAVRMSKSRPAVANALRLLALPSELIGHVSGGELPAGSARALLSLKSTDRMLKAAKVVTDKAMNVREVEAYVKKLNKQAAQNDETDETKDANDREVKVDYLREAQNRLTEAMGHRVTIKKRGSKGKIEIEFFDDDDFNALYDMLVKDEDK